MKIKRGGEIMAKVEPTTKCSMGCIGTGGTFSNDDAFCWKCGAPLEKWISECPECKHQGCALNKFCVKCGKPTIEVKLPWKENKNAK